MAKSIRSRQATAGRDVDLTLINTAASPGVQDKGEAHAFVESLGVGLRDNQIKLLAGQEHAVLLVLQGMDACGKDGVVKHVIDLLYPTSVSVKAFKAPTDEEKQHDFLWRYRQQLPSPGSIGVFNRSWYEDVGVVKVHQLEKPDVIEQRYAQINAFEQELAADGIRLIKCFLHISYEEQGQRMLDRLYDPTKRWKFKTADLDERDFWADYMKVYSQAISRCGTKANPWYVVPADHKWYRDWVIAQLLAETLDDLKLHFPARPDLDITALIERITRSIPSSQI